jgi:chromosome segregation ATPase
LLETQLFEDGSKEKLRIQDLETDLAAAHAKSESLLTDYSALEEELIQVKGKQAKVELQVKSLTSKLEMTHKVVAQYARAESAVESAFSLKRRFHRAK